MKKWIVRILVSIVALIFVGMLVIPKAPQAAYYQNAQRPMVIAHQGGDGLWPSNTLFAFEHAAELGVDGIITDRPDLLMEVLGR